MNNNSNNVYDITIIGAGPVGLFATFYAGMRSMKVKVIDALPELGGQLSALYPEKPIYDIPGFNKVRAKDLVERLEGQATKYNPTQCLNEKVLSLHRNEDGLIELKTNKKTHLSKTILICAGLGAFTPNKLEVTGVSEYEEKGIFYYIKNISDLSGKKVLVIGGGDSAVDWSLSLIEIAKKVILIHRRDKFTAHEDSVIKLLTSDVDVRVNHVLKEVRGSKTIKEAILLDNQKGKETKIEIDAILINIGRKADLGPIKEWGLEIGRRSIIVNGKMETNIPGIYAAGDVASPSDSEKVNLIVIGFGQATIAVNHAKKFIDPNSAISPGHSTFMK